MLGEARYFLMQCKYKGYIFAIITWRCGRDMQISHNSFHIKATISYIFYFPSVSRVADLPWKVCSPVHCVRLSYASRASKICNSPDTTSIPKDLRQMPIKSGLNQPLSSIPRIPGNRLLYLVPFGRIISNSDQISDHDVDDQVPRITLVGIFFKIQLR